MHELLLQTFTSSAPIPLPTFDLGSASLSGTPLDVTDTGLVFGFDINSDGTRVYTSGRSREIRQYNLSSAYDLSSAVFTKSFNVGAQETRPAVVTFNIAGDRMFVAGESSNNVHQYNLSTPFEVDTASFISTLSVAATARPPSDVAFNPTGSEMYILNSFPLPRVVRRYTLSTPFQLNTATSTSVVFSVPTTFTNPRGLAFASGGEEMFICGTTADQVVQYSLDNPFDIAGTFTTGSSLALGMAPEKIKFDNAFTRMFVLDRSANTVSMYTA